jgi:hypothetical protein
LDRAALRLSRPPLARLWPARLDPSRPAASRSAAGAAPLLLATVAAAPLLVPQMTYNMVPADFVIALFVVVGLASLSSSRARVHLPLGMSYVLVLAGGAIGISQAFSPADSLVVVLQDLYLFVWFVVLVNYVLQRGRGIARAIGTVWVWTGLVVALFVWLTALQYPGPSFGLFGTESVDLFGRAKGTFRDPNLAGNYLVVSLFVLWAAPRPRGTALKLLVTVPMVLAIYVTDSITALVALGGGMVLSLVVGLVTTRRAAVAASLAGIAVMVAGVTLLPRSFEGLPSSVSENIGSSETFSDSLGRTEVSATGRIERWKEALLRFGDQVLIGIGPGSTAPALAALGVDFAGELHNDYLAGFLERGVLGGIGVLALFAIVSAWAFRCGFSQSLRREGWRPSFLVGGLAAILASAMALETLHFRHIWLFFALLAGLAMTELPRTRPAAAPGRHARALPRG